MTPSASSPSFASVKSPSFLALGIDVGGTKIAAGLITFPAGLVRFRRVIPTQPRRGGDAVLADVERLVDELAAEARADQLTIGAIGLGVCELVDLNGAVVSNSTLNWQGLPVRERLSRIAPAYLEADVRAAALGEALHGAGRPFRQFLYVTIGTGISSCLVLDGRPFTGSRGATGTMASSPLPSPDGMSGSRQPTLEELASGPALVARFNAAGGKVASGEEVLTAAASGEPDAVAIVRSAAQVLGASIGGLVNVLDPAAIVIGGGLGLSRGLFRDTLEIYTRQHIWSELHRDLPILPAALGLDAGIVGAAATAWQRLNQCQSKTSDRSECLKKP